jgi:two-component system sensor kinase FixL
MDHSVKNRFENDVVSADRLTVVLSTAVDGVIIIDDGGLIDVFNPACERLFGYAAEEVIGKNVHILMPSPYHEEHDRYLNNYLATGERKIIGIGREVTGRRKDGSAFPMELSVGEATHDSQRIFVGIIRDISERKAAEDELRESENRMRAVIETAVDSVIIIDGKADIQIFNRACERLFGYTANEVIGRNVKMLMPTPYREEHDGYMQNYLLTGERKIIGIGREVTGRRKNGSTFPMELSVGEAQQGGRPVFVGIIRDITERKAAELAISRRVEELAAFAYSVAYDLKAPLRAIAGFSTALSEDYHADLDEIARSYLDFVNDGANRMAEMIDDLLEYSRIGRDDVQFVWIRPDEIVRHVINSLSAVIDESGAKITVEGEWDEIQGHPSIISNALQNLITNSLKFTKPGEPPRIDIRGRRLQGAIEISITDHGIGIPADCHDKIFQIFHRLHDQTDYPGTGIGLALVRKGVDLHHGRISLESEVGDHTTFRLMLPMRQPDKGS